MEAHIILRFFERHSYGNSIETIAEKLKTKPKNFWPKDAKHGEFEQGFDYEKKLNVNYVDDKDICDFLEEECFSEENIAEISKLMGFDLELFIAIYTNGQANPGVHIGHQTFKAFQNKFGILPEIDFDIYMTNE